ncbi:MAG: hypothetical protein HZC41_24965 [Chloroflexi bacterium]|nr:hypothetical protein [Chloroflexota bacterium]
MIDLQQIVSLTIDERIDARARAREMVTKAAGDMPARDQFNAAAFSRYPGWVTALVTLAMVIVFVAAAAPSLFRLFTAGRDYFLAGIADSDQAAIAGAATFLLAEFLVIVSTLAMRVYFAGRARLVMIVPISFGVLMALVGNWVIAQPIDLFGLLETFAPPVAVLFMSLIGERLILAAIDQRQQNENDYQAALAEWKAATSAPEKSAAWKQMYANVLREMLLAKNKGRKYFKENYAAITTATWKALVWREMQADDWYTAEAVPEAAPAPVATANSNGHGHEDFLALPVMDGRSVTAFSPGN